MEEDEYFLFLGSAHSKVARTIDHSLLGYFPLSGNAHSKVAEPSRLCSKHHLLVRGGMHAVRKAGRDYPVPFPSRVPIGALADWLPLFHA
jgi:hypothetical protein